ncbi:MAG TPA: glutamate racemase [Candidatus Nitrosocosmicus sp.]|nr:glutamate racemase [Candidatus Nitrosocosmicus sp.]
MNIGFFDSGIGGLSILKEVVKRLPQYNYIYLADNLNVPYGEKSADEIYILTIKAVEFLFHHNCDLVILACNTATTTSLSTIQQQFLPAKYPEKKVLGITRPAMEGALETHPKIIGVIATEATVRSESFPIELNNLHENIPVFQQACPKLVPLIESGKTEEIDSILPDYLNPLLEKNIDTLILGCTHYGLISAQIKKHIGPHIRVIGEGVKTAVKLEDYLKRHIAIEQKLSQNSTRDYFVTKEDPRYQPLFRNIMEDESINLITCNL